MKGLSTFLLFKNNFLKQYLCFFILKPLSLSSMFIKVNSENMKLHAVRTMESKKVLKSESDLVKIEFYSHSSSVLKSFSSRMLYQKINGNFKTTGIFSFLHDILGRVLWKLQK